MNSHLQWRPEHVILAPSRATEGWRGDDGEDYERVLCFNMTARPDVRAAIAARDIDMEPALRAYQGPLLVSHGRQDSMVLPATAYLVRDLCPQAQLSWYDEAAHGPFFEVPVRFNGELAKFVLAAGA